MGINTFLIPAFLAAAIFAVIPPTGLTFPLMVISPVIASKLLTGISLTALYILQAIAIPAEGPSTGIPPGKFTWISYLAQFILKVLSSTVSTFSTEQKAVLFLLIFLFSLLISSASTIPVTFNFPEPLIDSFAVASTSNRVPILEPYTATPLTRPI